MFTKVLNAIGLPGSKGSKSPSKSESDVSSPSSYQISEPAPGLVPPSRSTSEEHFANNGNTYTTRPSESKPCGSENSRGGNPRSSFANESRAYSVGGAFASRGREHSKSSCRSANAFMPPDELLQPYLSLGIIVPDTPVPMSMLKGLWQMDLAQVEELAAKFKRHDVLRIATLEDDSLWCIVTAEHLGNIEVLVEPAAMKGFHQRLLQFYTDRGKLPLSAVVDDGYIIKSICHHLEGAGRENDLYLLLTEPLWVENKLHAYGIASIVQDFRKYLGVKEDFNVKLLLQAFQLSIGCCMEHPGVHMLKEQMLARLMAVAGPHSKATEQGRRYSADASLHQWFSKHRRSISFGDSGDISRVVHLMPLSASMEQAGGLHRMTLRGHSAPIHQVLISPNGQDVMTVSEDGSAQVWDMNIGDCVLQLGRDTPLTDAAVAPGGQIAVIASEDGHCCVWDMAAGEIKHVLKGHKAKVNAIAIDRQGLRCISASDDHSVRVWNISDGSCESILSGHGEGQAGAMGNVIDVAISLDGALAATVSNDFTCRVWDLDEGEGECLHVMQGHSGWVVSVEFLGSTTDLITASHDSTARVWDGEKGKCLHTLSGHTGRLNKVIVDPGGMFGVTCSDDNTARVWDLDQGTCLQVLRGHSGWINDAAITRDGSCVITVSGDHLCALWDVKSGKMEMIFEGHSDSVRSVVLTDKGRFAVTASDDHTARVWDTQAPNLNSVEKHAGKVKHVCSLPGLEQVVSVGEDGCIMVWSSKDGELKFIMEGHKSPVSYLGAHLTDGMVISGSGDRQVCVWNTCTGMLEKTLPAQLGSRVKAMAFDRSCALAAVVLFDGTVSVWDLQTGTCIQQLIRRGQKGSEGNIHSGGVNSIYMSKNGNMVVTTGKDCTARVWDLASCTVTAVVIGHEDSVICAALNPDEVLVATSALDGTIRVSTVSEGTSVAVLRQPGGANAKQVAFSPDGTLLVAVLDNDSAVLWDLLGTEEQKPMVLASHKGEIYGACFSPAPYWRNGALMATWSQDGSVQVWRVSSVVTPSPGPAGGSHRTANARKIAMFMADGAISSCCFAGPQSDVLVVGDAMGAVHFLDLPLELQCQNS